MVAIKMRNKIRTRFRCSLLAIRAAPLLAMELQLVGKPIVLAVKHVEFAGLKSAYIRLQIAQDMLSMILFSHCGHIIHKGSILPLVFVLYVLHPPAVWAFEMVSVLDPRAILPQR